MAASEFGSSRRNNTAATGRRARGAAAERQRACRAAGGLPAPPRSEAAGGTKDPAKVNLARLIAARVEGWPDPLEKVWQFLVGRRFDARQIPGVHNGEYAADYLRRGGELTTAAASARRSVAATPADGNAWLALARIDPLPAAARAAFHGAQPPLTGLDRVVDALTANELKQTLAVAIEAARSA